MTSLYQSDPQGFSDQELQSLIDEIEQTGILSCECSEWGRGDESWEAQASRRWDELIHEQQRRNPRKDGPGLSLQALNDYTRDYITPQAMDSIFFGNSIIK